MKGNKKSIKSQRLRVIVLTV